MMRIVVLVAHPDDEVLGCGGWIASLINAGHNVSVIFTTDGVRHPPISTDSRPDSYKALSVLGVAKDKIHFLDIPTQRSDEIVLRDYTPKVEEVAQHVDLAILPSKDDLNVDHVFAYKLGMICFRPIKWRTRIVSMEILSSSEWSDHPFQPNYYIDISAFVDKKVEALSKYQKQLLPFPHPRSPDAIRVKAQQRGLEVGYGHAEAFRIVRWFE